MNSENVSIRSIRDEILEYISDFPGVTYVAIKKAFRMNDGTLRYHLDHLVREEKIKRTGKGKRRYYSMDRANLRTVRGLTGDQNRVLTAIKCRPNITLSELRKSMRLTRDEINYATKKLRARKFIIRTQGGKDPTFEYVSGDDLEHEIMKIVEEKYGRGEIDERTLELIKKTIEEKLRRENEK